jgi:serine/threonine protein kinase
MSSSGVPLLTDFGVSRVIAASNVTTDTTSFKGSTRWMAPELLKPAALNHEPVKADEKTDAWAFGMTIYVSKCKPFLII